MVVQRLRAIGLGRGLWISWFVFEKHAHICVVYHLWNWLTLGGQILRGSKTPDVKASEYRKKKAWLIAGINHHSLLCKGF